MNEYIIVNKTVIENRIQELEKDLEDEPNPFLNTSYQSELDVLKKILSQSTPLIPEIEKAYDAGSYNHHSQHTEKYDGLKKDHISNLKLDI